MIVRDIKDCIGTEREVVAKTWTSLRVLLASDGMGFSLHETTMREGTSTPMHYTNHLEAVFCIEGEGEIEESANGKRHAIRPGVMYALDQHDKHVLRAATDLRLMCVFNPPVTGKEVHDASGAYPIASMAAAPSAASPTTPGKVSGKGENK